MAGDFGKLGGKSGNLAKAFGDRLVSAIKKLNQALKWVHDHFDKLAPIIKPLIESVIAYKGYTGNPRRMESSHGCPVSLRELGFGKRHSAGDRIFPICLELLPAIKTESIYSAMMKLVMIATITLFLAGCVTAPTPAEMASADYGPPPASDYQQQIKDYMTGSLKDPMSAVYMFSEPVKGFMHDAPIAGGKTHFYWRVDAKINAKNSYGGCAGFTTYSFWFHNGKIVGATNPEGLGFGPNGESQLVTP